MTSDPLTRTATNRLRSRAVWTAATAPGLALILSGVVWTFVPGLALWPADTVNLVEAAATRNTGEVLRQLSQGEDAQRPQPVRAGLLDSSQIVQATPLEAAVRIKRGDVIWTLLQYGPRPQASTLAALRCQVADDRALLQALGDVSTEPPVCPPVNDHGSSR